MSKYSELMEKHDQCITQANETQDNLKAQYLVRAAQGYKTKAENLKLKEAMEE